MKKFLCLFVLLALTAGEVKAQCGSYGYTYSRPTYSSYSYAPSLSYTYYGYTTYSNGYAFPPGSYAWYNGQWYRQGYGVYAGVPASSIEIEVPAPQIRFVSQEIEVPLPSVTTHTDLHRPQAGPTVDSAKIAALASAIQQMNDNMVLLSKSQQSIALTLKSMDDRVKTLEAPKAKPPAVPTGEKIPPMPRTDK